MPGGQERVSAGGGGRPLRWWNSLRKLDGAKVGRVDFDFDEEEEVEVGLPVG